MGSGFSCSQPETQTGLARFLKLLSSRLEILASLGHPE